jgi:hypothetical protein
MGIGAPGRRIPRGSGMQPSMRAAQMNGARIGRGALCDAVLGAGAMRRRSHIGEAAQGSSTGLRIFVCASWHDDPTVTTITRYVSYVHVVKPKNSAYF